MNADERRLEHLSRRGFLALGASCLVPSRAQVGSEEPILDIHQHTTYSGRSDEQLIAHQREMGIAKTVLLPAGSKYGLAVGAGGNGSVMELARQYPGRFLFFANEVPDLAGARQELEKYLKAGAIGIGEQKFPVACDSPHIAMVAEVAREFGVPVLLHFQHGVYNTGFERFHSMLEKYSEVKFIGHAQTWWGNIDRDHDQTVMYPKTRVTRGGITDRLLSDYPNIYGDLSAGSGLNALLRDEDHAREFLARHQDRLLYGSDCSDSLGKGEGCSGSRCISAIRKLAPNQEAIRKILYENAARLLKIQ